MRTVLLTTFALVQALVAWSQKKEHLVNTYLSFHVNRGLYDRTLSNNTTGFGGGMQVFVNADAHFKPNLEIDADVFGGTKELYLTPDGKIIYAKDEVLNVWLGAAYVPQNKFFVSLAAGPSFFNNHSYLSVKPAAGYFLTSSKRLMAKVSFINVFQKDEISNQSFGYLNFSFGFKLF